MRAVVRERYGNADVLELRDVPTPDVSGDRLRIRIEGCGLNRSDWEALVGRPAYTRMNGPFRPRNQILGTDVVGVVDAVGPDVTDHAVGERVFGDLMWHAPHGLAEYVVTSQEAPLAVVPNGLSIADAASLPQAGCLALQALTDVRPVGPDDRVLVVGGGGGVGTFAIQLARSMGAEVHAVDGAGKLDLMRTLGAVEVFDHRVDDVTRVGPRYTRIVDLVAKRSMRSMRRILTSDGVYFLVGGSVPRLFGVLIAGGFTTRLSDRTMKLLAGRPAPEPLLDLAGLVLSGVVTPVIDSTVPLEHAPEALARIGAEEALGNIVVVP